MNKEIIQLLVIFWGLILITVTLIVNFKAALIISIIITALFSVFVIFHRERKLKSQSFEINSSNKDPRIGLLEYNNRIESFLFSLGYSKYFIRGNQYVFRPRPYQRIMGGDIYLHFDPLYTEVKGPKGMVEILLKIIEIPYMGKK
jgi:hypothetical protein